MSNRELPLTVFVSLQRGSEIPGALNPEYDKICVNPCNLWNMKK